MCALQIEMSEVGEVREWIGCLYSGNHAVSMNSTIKKVMKFQPLSVCS